LTTVLFIFDMLNLIESRLILMDSQLMFWLTVCLLVGVMYIRRKQEHAAAEAVIRQAAELGVPVLEAETALLNATVVQGQTGHSKAGGDDAVFDHGSDTLLGGIASYGAFPRQYLLSFSQAKSGKWGPNPHTSPATDDAVSCAESNSCDVARLKVAPWPCTGEAPRLLSRFSNLLWCGALGLACGCAVSVKWTGLGTPGLIALECWLGIFFLAEPVAFLDMLVMLASAFVFYLGNYWVHFQLLPNTGDGDAFMRAEFQKTLVGNENYDAAAPHPGFIRVFFQLAWEMLSGNARIDQRHNWESTWDQWIFNQRGVLYHSNTTEPIRGRTESVYLLGNPAAIWFVAAVVAVAILYLFTHYRCRTVRLVSQSRMFRGNSPALALIVYCLVGYFCNLLPYLSVSRSCFAYHYMPALLYGEILAGVMVERLFGKRLRVALVVQYITTAVFCVFVFFAPWIYSLPLSAEGHQQRRWLKSWD
jgi:dolichyl-phosphate-mannose--protein O-mannosyl transferase